MDAELRKKKSKGEAASGGFEVPPKVAVADRTEAPAKDGPKPVRGAELTARARLEQLFDAGTFVEIDAHVQHRGRAFGMAEKKLPGDGVICGFGEIHGHTVYAYAQDRAVLGGSLGEAHAQKVV